MYNNENTIEQDSKANYIALRAALKITKYLIINTMNSGHRLWLAKTTRTFRGCFNVIFWLTENVLLQFC